MILLGITLLSIILRFIEFPHTIQWQDTGMELLRAFHVAYYQEYPLLGVPALSLYFYHPPWYLYLLGMGAKLIPNIPVLLGISVFIHATSIVPFYLITRAWFGKLAGLLSSFFYAIHPLMIDVSHSLQSQNIIVPFFLWTFALWLHTRKHPSFFLKAIHVGLLTFAVSINYAAGIFVGLIFLWELYEARKNTKMFLSNLTLWLAFSLFWLAPLFFYFGLETLRVFIQAPYTILTNTATKEVHHIYLFVPLFYITLAWIITYVWQHTRYSFVKFTLTICVILITAYWFLSLPRHLSFGDYDRTVSCGKALFQSIQHNEDIHIGTRIGELKDKREYLLILVEQFMGKKLVQLKPTGDFFDWIRPSNTIHLLCIPTPKDTYKCTDPLEAQQANFSYVKELPIDTSLPCSLHAFIKN